MIINKTFFKSVLDYLRMEVIAEKNKRIHIIILTLEALPIDNVIIPQRFIPPDKIYYLIESVIQPSDIELLKTLSTSQIFINILPKVEIPTLLLEIAAICNKERGNLIYVNCFGHQYVPIAALYAHMLFDVEMYCPKINETSNQIETIISPFIFDSITLTYPKESICNFLIFASTVIERRKQNYLLRKDIYAFLEPAKFCQQTRYLNASRIIDDLLHFKLATTAVDCSERVSRLQLTEQGLLLGKLFRVYLGDEKTPWVWKATIKQVRKDRARQFELAPKRRPGRPKKWEL